MGLQYGLLHKRELDRSRRDSYARYMSNLFRKEALTHRSRALYGEVILRSPPATWVITVLLLTLAGALIAGAFLLKVETEDGTLRLIDWLLRGGR